MNGIFLTPTAAPPLFAHQETSVEFYTDNPRVFDMSDPGTGKTRVGIESYRRRLEGPGAGRLLVLAPKTILQPAWGHDFCKFAPDIPIGYSFAGKREQAYKSDAQVVITNHDAVNWIVQNPKYLDGFDEIIVDESTAFKHRTSNRSKALRKLIQRFHYRRLLSGTPNPNGLTDLWHQVLLLDDGERLGTSFWRFRNTVCEPAQVGPSPDMVNWSDREGAAEAVADLLADITVRHIFEETVSIPANQRYTVPFTLSPAHRKAYEELRRESLILLESGEEISAVHAASLYTKLLQMASGAVYDSERVAHHFASERYELVMELAEQRKQCLIAFNWRHQRDALVEHAEKRGFSFAVIDGSASTRDREEAVEGFQRGDIKLIFAHPQSASHGLTLTRGTTTIWTSPTSVADLFQQYNRRIYRAGQTRKTETILIAAENTLEAAVYEKLDGKLDAMSLLLEIVNQ